MICSRCGHPDIPKSSTACPNCGFAFKSSPRPTTTTSFKALSARRKMLTSRHFSMPFALGDDAFKDYIIRDILGQGPLGVVYMAHNHRGDPFALKVLHKRWRSEVDLEQLQGAYLAVEGLKHSGRLNLPVEVLIDDNHIGLLSAHLDGLTVRKVMNLRKNTSKAFRLDELTQLVHGISTPIKSLHRENTAHGGLKPENFFVSADDNQEQVITISDTCLSSALGIKSYHKAQRAAGHGHYLAPEISEGDLHLSSDVFSLGAFIFEGITGQVYQAKKTVREIIPAQGIEPLEAFFERALHPEPDQRYRDISALISAYDDVAAHLDQLEGSPFNSEGTQPRNESMVTRFSITGGNLAPVSSDPLLGEEQEVNQTLQSKTPPPLPPGGISNPPPLPPTGLPNTHLGSSPFPIHETPPPSLDVLDLSQQQSLAPSFSTLSDDLLDAVGQPSLIDLPIGAPQSLPKRPLQPQSSNRSSSVLMGVVATAIIAFGVYLFLGERDVTTEPVTLSIELPSSAKRTDSVSILKAEQGAKTSADASSKKEDSTIATGSKTEAESKARAEAESKARAEAESKARAEAESKARAEAESKARAEAESKARAEAESKARAEAESKARAQQEAKARAQREAKAKAERETKKPKNSSERTLAAKEARQKDQKEREERELAKKEARQKAQKERDEQARIKKEARQKAQKERDEQARIKKEARQKAQKEQIATKQLVAEKTKAPSSVVVPKKATIQGEDAKELKCPSGMILKRTARFPRGSVRRGKIKGKKAIALARKGKAYCIDAYEYPGRGQKPKVNVTFKGAQSLCSQANKRLCTGNEWTRTCKGSRGAAYPYGKKFNPNKCITEDKEGEERKLSRSGSMRTCKSASGAYDMSGNASEWTADQRVRGWVLCIL